MVTRDEAQRELELTPGKVGLSARLLYGTGMHYVEGPSPGVKDVDFERLMIFVRDGKGGKGIPAPRP